MIPFTVIGGFLGSGKTTLLNRLLVDTGGERIAVIVNDVGDVPIDTELIADHDGNTITLTNGCICCSLSDEFALALPDLAEMDPPLDRVVVEASGLSDPGAVAQYGTLPGFRLDGVVVTADAETVRARADDPRIGAQVRHQLVRADLVVITKADLVDATTLAEVGDWLADLTATTPVVTAKHGHVPVEVLLGRWPQDPTVRNAPVGAADDLDAGAVHGLDVTTIRPDRGVSRAEITALLDSLGDVLRAKGVVAVDERGDDGVRAHEVHVVGRRRRITAARSDAIGPGRIVVVTHPGALGPHDVAPPFRLDTAG